MMDCKKKIVKKMILSNHSPISFITTDYEHEQVDVFNEGVAAGSFLQLNLIRWR